jgi:hypothetical protein
MAALALRGSSGSLGGSGGLCHSGFLGSLSRRGVRRGPVTAKVCVLATCSELCGKLGDAQKLALHQSGLRRGNWPT